MKLNTLIRVADALEIICENTDTIIPDAVSALVGICFTEEEASQVLAYHTEDPE